MDLSREEKTAMAILAVFLLVGSAVMYRKETRPIPIVIERGGRSEIVSLREAGERVAEDTRIDINTAGKEELCSLPGVGEAIAERIIEYRETRGSFLSPEDLMRVSGIGEKKLKKIRPLIKPS